MVKKEYVIEPRLSDD